MRRHGERHGESRGGGHGESRGGRHGESRGGAVRVVEMTALYFANNGECKHSLPRDFWGVTWRKSERIPRDLWGVTCRKSKRIPRDFRGVFFVNYKKTFFDFFVNYKKPFFLNFFCKLFKKLFFIIVL